MGNELLTLALTNHAIAHGMGYDEAWELAESVVAEHGGESVKELANRVRHQAASAIYSL